MNTFSHCQVLFDLFDLFGLTGLLLEFLFRWFMNSWALATGGKPPRLGQGSLLWMFPVYGVGGLLLVALESIAPARLFVVAGVSVVYGTEYLAGRLFRRHDICPWDYTGDRYATLDGLIRLDFAPIWAALVFGFDLYWRA